MSFDLTAFVSQRGRREEDHRERFLGLILGAGLIIVPVLLLAGAFLSSERFALAVFYSSQLGVIVICLVLLRKGFFNTSGLLLLTSSWAALTILGAHMGGLRAPGILGYLFFAVIAGLLWGTRGALAAAILMSASTLVLALGERYGWLPSRTQEADPLRIWLTLGATLALITAIFHAGLRSLREALQRAETNERQIAELLRQSPDAIVQLDRRGVIESFNRVAQRTTGLREAEVLGRPFYEVGLFSVETVGRAIAEFQAVVAGEARIVAELEILGRQGAMIPVEISASLFSNPESDKVSILLIARDISERRQAEARLQQVQERYRLLFEEAPIMYVVTRSESGTPVIEDCNQMFLRTLDYSRGEVVGRPLVDFYSPESSHELLEEGGYARALEGLFEYEERQLVSRGGELVETLLRAVPVRDYSGGVVGTRAMYINIAARKHAEAALRISEERYRQLFETSQDAVFMTTPSGELLDINPAGVTLFGFSSQEELRAAGYPAAAYTDPGNRERLASRLAGEGFVRDYPLKLRSASGDEIELLETATAVRAEDGSVALYLGILRPMPRKEGEQDD